MFAIIISRRRLAYKGFFFKKEEQEDAKEGTKNLKVNKLYKSGKEGRERAIYIAKQSKKRE